uniref:Putative ovule protein n=1 Tax=Solanum chacoense TaxID=4108 RepID=A0A0V0GVZ7_SOLCH
MTGTLALTCQLVYFYLHSIRECTCPSWAVYEFSKEFIMFWATPPIALRFCVRCSYSFQMVSKPNFGKLIWHNFFSLPTIML